MRVATMVMASRRFKCTDSGDQALDQPWVAGKEGTPFFRPLTHNNQLSPDMSASSGSSPKSQVESSTQLHAWAYAPTMEPL